MMSSIVVDVHAHLYPEAWRSSGRMPDSMFDIPGLVQRLDEGGVDRVLVSDPHIWYGDLDVAEIDQVRVYNDFAASLAATSGGRALGMASITPWRGAEQIEEARRAIDELGLMGVAIPTSDRGQYLDSVPEDFLELVEGTATPVFLHPAGAVIGQELMGEYRLGEVCGRPLDTTVTLARAILMGVLERHPNLQLLCSHAGGAICTVADRLDFGHELRDYAPLGPWGEVHLEAPPSTYVRRLWLDTVTYGPGPLRLAVETVGATQVCFGSDGPPVPFPISRHRAVVDQLALDASQHEAIMGGNAQRLFPALT